MIEKILQQKICFYYKLSCITFQKLEIKVFFNFTLIVSILRNLNLLKFNIFFFKVLLNFLKFQLNFLKLRFLTHVLF